MAENCSKSQLAQGRAQLFGVEIWALILLDIGKVHKNIKNNKLHMSKSNVPFTTQ